MPNPNTFAILEGLGYDPVDIESEADYLRALKESIISLSNSNPRDSRISILQDAVKGLRQARSGKEAAKSGGKSRAAKRRKGESFDKVKAKIDAKEKKKKAINFVKGAGPEPVDAAPADGGGMSSTLMKISNDVNIIKGIVASQNKLDKDKADDTREAREKNKRSMAENLMEGGKGAFKKVAGAFGKVLEPAKGIFESIFNFLKLFVLGAGLMKILDWFGNSENKSKIQSIFRFLKDWWPAILGALMAFIPGFPVLIGVVALAVGFLPKIIDTVKMLFGFNKQIDKEIASNEKDLENTGSGLKVDEDTGEGPPIITDDTSATVDTSGAGEKSNVTEPQMFNQGGEVPGQGSEDTVPAMLTPGEFVLTKDAVNRVGADTLYGMNAAAGGTGKPKSGKAPAKKKPKAKISTVGTMMNMGGLNMGGMSGDVQSYKFGGMVRNFVSKSPQARAIRFAANQIKKSPVGTPISKALKSLKMLGKVPSGSSADMGDPMLSGEAIPSFNVIAPGGRAKEQTLGVRR